MKNPIDSSHAAQSSPAPSAIRAVLANYDLGRIEKIEALPTSGNFSYIITASLFQPTKYFLRLCPDGGPRWRSPEEITAEIELIEHVRAAGFPTPAPLKNKTGQKVISLGRRHGYLREFVDGAPQLEPNREQVTRFGETVGWLHSLTQNYHPNHRRDHVFDLAETRRHFQEKKAAILASNFRDKKKFVAQLEATMAALDFPADLPRGMIHEDLGKRHVLWRENKVVALIDFDRSYFGPLVLDLGQAGRGWCFVDNWQRWSNENFRAVLAGYQQRRRLTAREKQYLPAAIKFGILERALSFCFRFIEVTHDREDERFARDSLFRQIDLVPGKD